MIRANFKIVEHGSEEWLAAVKLREDILRKPLGSRFSSDELDEEKDCIQVIGLIEKELISTAVLMPEGLNLKMQRVVVTDRLRNLSIG